jgi:hypothetical protein
MMADNAPLAINFPHEAFILPNHRILPESVLVERLEDKLLICATNTARIRFQGEPPITRRNGGYRQGLAPSLSS